MKKIITAILAIAMVLSLGTVSVFAATVTVTQTGNQTGAVNAKYVPGEHGTVYSVEITWGAMQFEYNAKETWNTSSHKWEATSPTWAVKDSSNTITLANNSSVAVDASFAFAAGESYNTVSGAFTSESTALENNKFTMPVAAADADATEHIVTFTLSGTLDKSVIDSTNVGTITISLAEPTPQA